MSVFLWVLQILLAVHTVMGALWKFSNSSQAVPSLSAIPHSVWLAMSVVEILCALGLIAPVVKSLGKAAPISALLIAAEMLALCVIAIVSGEPKLGEIAYWLVVAIISAFVAYGRFVLRPF